MLYLDDYVVLVGCCFVLLGIFIVVFRAAYVWMRRYDKKAEELERARELQKEAEEEARTWREVAEDLVRCVEGRAS